MNLEFSFNSTMIFIYKLLRLILTMFKSLAFKLTSGSFQYVLLKKINLYINKYCPSLYDDLKFLNYVKSKRNGIENYCDQIETIAIGCSYTDFAFVPSIIDNSYNFGLTSADLYLSYKQYSAYRQKLHKLQNVLLFFHVFLPGYSLNEISERYRLVAYKYFFNITYQNSLKINKRIEKHIQSKCRSIDENSSEIHYRGYTHTNSYGNFNVKNRTKTHLRENLRNPSQVEWYFMLKTAVKKDNRNFIVVIPPFRSDYKKQLPKKEILFEKLLTQKETCFLIIDFYDSTLFVDDDFGDTDHLNEAGALKLTIEIKKIMIEKGII